MDELYIVGDSNAPGGVQAETVTIELEVPELKAICAAIKALVIYRRNNGGCPADVEEGLMDLLARLTIVAAEHKRR